MAKIPRTARFKPIPYREPWCLTWLRLTWRYQARKTMRECQADKYNLKFMEGQISATEALALDDNRPVHEKNLLEIQRKRGIQQACMEEFQAEQVLVYDTLRAVRQKLADLEAEMAKEKEGA